MEAVRERPQQDDHDTLVLLPAVELHRVESGREKLVERGPLSLSMSADSVITARVAATSWTLERTSPTLKSGEHAYVFAVPASGGTAFLSILLSTGTPDADHSLFEEILVHSTAFQLAGALSPQAVEEAIDAVAESLLTEGASPTSSSGSPTPRAASSARSPATAAAIEAVMQEQATLQRAPSSLPPGTAAAEQQQQQPTWAEPSRPAEPPPAEEHEDAGPSVGQMIGEGTQRVTEAIALSAVWASQKIMEQSDRWRRQIKPAEPVNISPEVKARIRMARDVAKKGAAAAGRMSQRAADISVRVAESIVRRVGPAAGFARAMKAGGQSRREAAQEIAAASLVAAVEIYVSMEEAARVVLASSGQAGSELVAHAYGPDAGEVSLHAAEATTHAATAAMQLRTLGVRSIARRIAKHTSVGFARAALDRDSDQPQELQPRSRPPAVPQQHQQQGAAGSRPQQRSQQGKAAPAGAGSGKGGAGGQMSPFAMAPAAIPDDPRAPIAAAPLQVALSGPLSPFALAQVPEEEAAAPSSAEEKKASPA